MGRRLAFNINTECCMFCWQLLQRYVRKVLSDVLLPNTSVVPESNRKYLSPLQRSPSQYKSNSGVAIAHLPRSAASTASETSRIREGGESSRNSLKEIRTRSGCSGLAAAGSSGLVSMDMGSPQTGTPCQSRRRDFWLTGLPSQFRRGPRKWRRGAYPVTGGANRRQSVTAAWGSARQAAWVTVLRKGPAGVWSPAADIRRRSSPAPAHNQDPV